MKLLKHASWSGFVYVAFLLAGMWLAGFLPSQPPSWGSEQIAAVCRSNLWNIRIGMVLALIGWMFYVPWTAILAKLIMRVEGGPGILTMSVAIAGCCNVLLTAYPAGY